jgi:exopolysaccharide production protein ExoZ
MLETRTRLDNIQALRGLAALLVVLSHLHRVEHKYSGDPLLPDWLLSGVSGVDLFFAISGFIMVVTTRGLSRGAPAAAAFLRRRAQRIYPTYWFYTALVLIVVAWQPAWVNQGRPFDLASSLLLLPHALHPLLEVAWSLEYEVYFYLVFALGLWRVPERRLGTYLGVWAAVVTGGWLLDRSEVAALRLVLHPFTLEFIGGCCVGLALRHPGDGARRAYWLALCAISVVALMSAAWLLDASADPLQQALRPWKRVIALGLPALALVAGAVMLDRAGWPFPRWLSRLGDASYSMYLSHVLVLSAIGRSWQRFEREGPLDNALLLVLCLLAVVGVGLASHRWIEQPLLRWRARGTAGAAENAVPAASDRSA